MTIWTVVLVKWVEGAGCERLLQGFISCICSQLMLLLSVKRSSGTQTGALGALVISGHLKEAWGTLPGWTLHQSHQSDLTVLLSTASVADKCAAVRKMRIGKSKVSWGEASIAALMFSSYLSIISWLSSSRSYLRKVWADKTFLKIYGFSYDSNGHLMRNKCNTTAYFSVCGRLRRIKQVLLTWVAGVRSTGNCPFTWLSFSASDVSDSFLTLSTVAKLLHVTVGRDVPLPCSQADPVQPPFGCLQPTCYEGSTSFGNLFSFHCCHVSKLHMLPSGGWAEVCCLSVLSWSWHLKGGKRRKVGSLRLFPAMCS